MIQKGYCIYCQNNNDKNKIFEVNSEASICFCPHCESKIKTSDAIKAYQDLMNKKINKVNYILFVVGDYKLAYQEAANVIELDKKEVRGRFTRLLALIKFSTLRYATFKSVYDLFIEERKTYYRKTKAYEYFSFLKLFYSFFDEYLLVMNKHLIHKGRFYDSDCIELYLTRIHQIALIYSLLLEEIQFLNKNDDIGEISDFYNLINNELSKLNSSTNGKHYSLDGKEYSLSCYDNYGSALIVKNLSNQLPAIINKKNYHLNPTEKTERSINDKIYKNYTKMINYYHVSLSLIISVLVISLLLVGSGLALQFLFPKPYFYYFYMGSGVFIIILIVLLIYRLLYQKIIKKREKYLIF